MSRITSQERRDVAKGMRYIANCCPPVQSLEQFRATLEDELFTGPGHANYTDIFSRLAGLIDPVYEPEPEWTAWVESLKEGDVVDRFAYDLIEHGGDMGPNGNTWNGVDEGLVLTGQLFDKFRADFKAEIGGSEVVQD